jgi:hypothetical protein
MYRCNSCDKTFDEPYAMSDVESHEFWGQSVRRRVIYDLCPHCESDDFDEARTCDYCDEALATVGDSCVACLEERAREAMGWAENIMESTK